MKDVYYGMCKSFVQICKVIFKVSYEGVLLGNSDRSFYDEKIKDKILFLRFFVSNLHKDSGVWTNHRPNPEIKLY